MPVRITLDGKIVPHGNQRKPPRPSWRARGYTAEYERNRRTVLAAAHVCWLCGQPPRPSDPLTCDHIVPREHGGGNNLANLAAAHASCNARRGSHPPVASPSRPAA